VILHSQATVREDLGELFKKMNHSKYQWMRDRITRLWPDWKLAAKQLVSEKSVFRNRRVKNVSNVMLTLFNKCAMLANQKPNDFTYSLNCFILKQCLRANLHHQKGYNFTLYSPAELKIWPNNTQDPSWHRALPALVLTCDVLRSLWSR